MLPTPRNTGRRSQRLERAAGAQSVEFALPAAAPSDIVGPPLDWPAVTSADATVYPAAPSLPPAPSATAAAATRKSGDAFAQLEAFVLQSFIQTMLPSNAQSFFGKGTAGEVWKSMLAEKLGAEIARSGQIGLAKRLAAGHSQTVANALPAAALGGAVRVSPELLGTLPYIQAAPAKPTERS